MSGTLGGPSSAPGGYPITPAKPIASQTRSKSRGRLFEKREVDPPSSPDPSPPP